MLYFCEVDSFPEFHFEPCTYFEMIKSLIISSFFSSWYVFVSRNSQQVFLIYYILWVILTVDMVLTKTCKQKRETELLFATKYHWRRLVWSKISLALYKLWKHFVHLHLNLYIVHLNFIPKSPDPIFSYRNFKIRLFFKMRSITCFRL